MATYPQYAKTDSGEVIAVIERNKTGREEVRQRAFEFAAKYGDRTGGDVGFYHSDFFDYCITGIMSDEKPAAGQWKRMHRAPGWLPYKNNPIHAELEELRFKPEVIPGTPSLLHSGYGRDGTQRVGGPTLFILDGVAYSGTSIQPIDELPQGSPWEEVKASEFHAAMEAYNERQRSE